MPEDVSCLLREAPCEEVWVHESRTREFEVFVSEHRERAVGLAWRLLGGDGAAAEDVAQEAFIRAHRALPGFRGEARLSTWFHRILVNEARRHQRWRWVRARRDATMPDDVEDGWANPPGDPSLRRRIGEALGELTARQREAFVLVHLEGFRVEEAAFITGRATGTLKSHLHRALSALRAKLQDLDPAEEANPR